MDWAALLWLAFLFCFSQMLYFMVKSCYSRLGAFLAVLGDCPHCRYIPWIKWQCCWWWKSPCLQWEWISDILSWCELSWQGRGDNRGTEITSYCDSWWRGREGMGKLAVPFVKKLNSPYQCWKSKHFFFPLLSFLFRSFFKAALGGSSILHCTEWSGLGPDSLCW